MVEIGVFDCDFCDINLKNFDKKFAKEVYQGNMSDPVPWPTALEVAAMTFDILTESHEDDWHENEDDDLDNNEEDMGGKEVNEWEKLASGPYKEANNF